MRWIYFILIFVPVSSQYSNSSDSSENLIDTPCTDRNHFFLAPGVLTAGGTNRACVSRFHPEGSARMLLTLIGENNQTVTASRELSPGDGGCLDISVPVLPNTKADLVVNIWYPQAKCAWERRVTLRISSGRVVVVHTERARYRPGESLRARVFVLKADLTPAPGNIEELWIEGPPGAWEGTRVAQWTKLRSKLGLAQIQHDIDELAPPGRWTVRARLADGSQGSAVFWVGNYELPPFQLTVRHAPRVLRTSERLMWTVCVRYPWTEAVEGMLVIRLRGVGSDSGGIRTAVQLRAPRACHRHAAAARRVGLGGEHPPDVVVADFSFQEEGTRVWQNTTVVSQVVEKAVTLEFLTKHRTLISPGLPYKLKVKATRWDDKPAPNERVRLCRYRLASRTDKPTDTPTCVSGDTDSGGVASLMFAAEDDGTPYYRFEASLYNDSSISAGPLTLSTRRARTQAALGPLRADSQGSRTFVPLYLTLQNVTTSLTVHFVVITRGGIIYRWGATTQCPIASTATHIQTAARNSRCNNPMAQYHENNAQDKNNNAQDENNQNNINNNHHENDNNRNDKVKSSRDYDVNLNLYTNKNQNLDIKYYLNKTNGHLTRNMNQNDKNNYIHKYDPNNTIHDRFNPVHIKTDVFERTQDVNSVQYEVNASDALLDRYLLRVMLPVKVTQQMCPDSHLVAYFYHDGEFVSATKHFEMDDCFVNKVEANFVSRQALPGSEATLQVSTPGPALCALTALDSAAKWTEDAVRDVLVRGLKRMIGGHRNVTEYDAAGDCFLSAADLPQPPSNSLELTASWLAAAGVRTVGDVPPTRSCDTPAALLDEGTVPRSDFSEAWLWRLMTVGANGTASISAKTPDSITRYEASAICLSKTGVAISQPAVLQVFREFFIHADGPRRLHRGDSTFIRYRLFNYLYEPLSVQIQILTGPGLQGPAELVESVCVPPRDSTARRAAVTATSAGEGRVVVRAKVVNDGGCGNTTYRRAVSDEVIMKIVIEPEGVPIQEHKSMLLCGKDNSNSTSSQVSWTFSQAEMIPGTEMLTVWTTGDIIGPLLADADSLVLLPRGCGEQNMARLATNLLALQHLHPHAAAALAAREHLARGFTRQLQYVHPSGGFSAFGASDVTSSTWLTAFSLRYLRRAHQVLTPNQPIPPAIANAEHWLLSQQMENGCFRNEGQVFHRELRGGLNEEGEIASVALTAYVITSLLESTSPLPTRVIRNTLSCLRALPSPKYNPPARVYAHSLLAYAFMRLKQYEEDLKKTNEARYEDLRAAKPKPQSELSRLQRSGLKEHEGLLEVMQLVKMATRDGEFLWWETGSLSTSLEATGYALLALRSSPSALREFGAGAVRWLSAHRGPTGGFVSTQDTLVALEALSAWSSLQPSPANLTVTARSGSVSRVARLDPTVHIPEVLKMGLGDQISIGVEGSGCALVQATRSYNAPSSARSQQQLSVQLTVHTDGTFDCDATGNCFCAAIIEACAVWGAPFPEMALLEVRLPGGYGADAARLYAQLQDPDTLLRRIEMSPLGSRATLYLAAREGTAPRRGHACFRVHAVGPRARTRPAHVRILDYYSPGVKDTQVYTIPEDCPSRVSHESRQDMTSDNLYAKARSMSDKDEILITHEFTYEDIPEGIPLEDPIYENLTKRDKDKSDLKKNYSTKINDKIDNSDININNDDIKYRKNTNTNIREKNYNIGNNYSSYNTAYSIANDNDVKYNPSEPYSSIHRNPLPHIPKNNQSVSPNRNILFRITNVIEAYEDVRNQGKVKIDDKLDITNKTIENKNTNITQTNAIQISKTSFVANDKLIGDLYKILNENAKSSIIKPDTTINKINDQRITEDQRSINREASTKSDIQNNISTASKTNNERNKHMSNQRLEIVDEQKGTNPKVGNPALSHFHVIDSEKDLEVPSGVEGPIPSIVLPPLNFVPPKQFPVTENLTPGNDRNNFDTRNNLPNNFVQQDGIPNYIFAPLHSLPNYYAAQDSAPNRFIPQSPPNKASPEKSASNTYVSLAHILPPKTPNQQSSDNFFPRNSVFVNFPDQNSPNFDSHKFSPERFVLQNAANGNLFNDNSPSASENEFAFQLFPNSSVFHNVPTNVVQRKYATPPSRYFVPPLPTESVVSNDFHSTPNTDRKSTYFVPQRL